MKGFTHVLDTSAILAHYWDEPGADLVDDLFRSRGARLGVSTVTVAELRGLLSREDPVEAGEVGVVSRYVDDLAVSIPADRTIAELAWQLRAAAPQRLPLVDAIIAATARSCDAILVHKDSHLAGIPEGLVRQLVLA